MEFLFFFISFFAFILGIVSLIIPNKMLFWSKLQYSKKEARTKSAPIYFIITFVSFILFIIALPKDTGIETEKTVSLGLEEVNIKTKIIQEKLDGRYVDLKIEIYERLDSIQIVKLSEELRPNYDDSKKVVFWYYLPGIHAEGLSVYATIFYPDKQYVRDGKKDQDKNGNKFVYDALGLSKIEAEKLLARKISAPAGTELIGKFITIANNIIALYKNEKEQTITSHYYSKDGDPYGQEETKIISISNGIRFNSIEGSYFTLVDGILTYYHSSGNPSYSIKEGI